MSRIAQYPAAFDFADTQLRRDAPRFALNLWYNNTARGTRNTTQQNVVNTASAASAVRWPLQQRGQLARHAHRSASHVRAYQLLRGVRRLSFSLDRTSKCPTPAPSATAASWRSPTRPRMPSWALSWGRRAARRALGSPLPVL